MMASCILPGGDPSIRMPFPALRSWRQRARVRWPVGVVAPDTIARSSAGVEQSAEAAE
jgi:hypothetical protein